MGEASGHRVQVLNQLPFLAGLRDAQLARRLLGVTVRVFPEETADRVKKIVLAAMSQRNPALGDLHRLKW